MKTIGVERAYLESLLNEVNYFSQCVEGLDFIEDTLTEIR